MDIISDQGSSKFSSGCAQSLDEMRGLIWATEFTTFLIATRESILQNHHKNDWITHPWKLSDIQGQMLLC